MSRREAAALRAGMKGKGLGKEESVARRARSHKARSHNEGGETPLLVAAALLYTAFVVYGSLVPLEYRTMPLAEAGRRFRDIPWLELGIGSRADWVANLLLFIPLAFLWLGVLWHRRSIWLRMAASLLVCAGAALLSIAIEFTQLFFPPRTVSQNDLLAEAIGAVLGVLAWWGTGPRVARWAGDWLAGRGDRSLARRLLYLYLAGLFAYNLLPLDLTISPVELFHKWQEGRVLLLPFSALPGEPALAVYELLSDVAIWVPVGLLWVMNGGSRLHGWRNSLLAALALEFLQLWVYSRVSDVTDVFTAALGAWIGVTVGARAALSAPAVRSHHPGYTVGFVSAMAVLAWSGVLAAVFWYPFDFSSDAQFLRERLASLQRAPFTAYYYGTEFRAVTEVLHKVLFFLPLGCLLGLAAHGFRLRGAWLRVFALLLGMALAGVIEGVQLALPGKNADLTDWALACLGVALGVWLAAALLRQTRWSGRRA